MFPYDNASADGPKRTEISMWQDTRTMVEEIKKARATGGKCQITHVNGITSTSMFFGFKYFTVDKGVTIDYMHNCLLGISKLMCRLWFTSSFSQKD